MKDLEAGIKKAFIDAIHEVSGRTMSNITADQAIAELGLDSVSVMEMVGALEDKLGIHFSDDDLSKVDTFADLAAAVKRRKPELAQLQG
jgi:acyl carrier protein